MCLMERDDRPCCAAGHRADCRIIATEHGTGKRGMAGVQFDEIGKVITAVNRHINGA